MSEEGPLGVAFLGGGSGGHIYPALAVADELHALLGAGGGRAVFLTGDRPADATALEGAVVFGLPAERVALPARPPSLRPAGLARCVASWGGSVRAARASLASLRSACGRVVAMSTGGYVSAPAAQAARVEGVPLVLVALDAVVGKANRYVARRARRRLMAQDTAAGRWEAVGPIVGPAARPPADARTCRTHLGLAAGAQTLLVLGGSQGASSLNALLEHLCASRPEAMQGWQVVHVSGGGHWERRLRDAYAHAGVPASVMAYAAPIGWAWGAADLALTRAGAGAVAEARASRTPAIFLPYPYHRDQHQGRNAAALVEAGAAVVVRDLVSPQENARVVAPLLERLGAGDLEPMRAAAGRLTQPAGAAVCARALVETAA